MRLLFGHGYLGSRIARLWRAAGHKVTVFTRSPAKAESLRAEGYGAIVADIGDPATLAAVPSELIWSVETVVFAVGYDRSTPADGSRRTIHEVYTGGVSNVMDMLSRCKLARREFARSRNMDITWATPSIPRFLYISSTGVYGDADGAWVDERTECRPEREGGRACLAAEGAIAAHEVGRSAVILRLAGIYGPGRIPRAEALKRYEPIDAPADGYLNLIHVDDAARIVPAIEGMIGGRMLPRTYNVADGNPGLRREYYTELARLLGAPKPVFVDPAVGSPAAARAAADKRISNRRLCEEVGPTFLYPSFREGLSAIVAAERASNK
jgi:nucleoside-diphosphate-sugar epimerase